MKKKSAPSVAATETSFEIIEALIELDGAGTTEVANEVDTTKSTVYNHLQTLLNKNYIVKENGTYNVGLKFLRVGEYARNCHDIAQVGPDEIDKLAEKTSEMANLVVEEHGRGVFLYRAKGSDAVHMDTHTGKRLPLHTTAFGKAILAHLPEEKVEEVVETHGLSSHTEQTITDKETLYNQLESIRDRGYAFDREERLEGLHCVAAPILDGDGQATGAVSVSGPKDRLRGERFEEEFPKLVRASANVIEINMTFG
ncbi:MAG: IclR family transcriptional regulator [Halovenus sp.]